MVHCITALAMQQVSWITALSLFLSFTISLTMLPLHGNVDIYITSSTEYYPCPTNKSCLTLEQFTLHNAKGSIESNATLHFLPGNHTLASKLTITDIESLSFLSLTSTMESLIECEDLGGFVISLVNYVKIQNLTFVNCKGNIFESVKQLTVRNCIFLVQNMDDIDSSVSNYSKIVLTLSSASVTFSNVSLILSIVNFA